MKDSFKGKTDCYIGNNYKKYKRGCWCIGWKKYLTESIFLIESMFGHICKKNILTQDGDHPNVDTSCPINNEENKTYKMLIVIINWVARLGSIGVFLTV